MDGTLVGTILEPVGDDSNAHTYSQHTITVQWQQNNTEVIRGTVGDIHTGAIIQAIGRYQGIVLVADQLVMLTDVANIQQ